MSSAGQRKDSLESLGRQHVHVGVGKKETCQCAAMFAQTVIIITECSSLFKCAHSGKSFFILMPGSSNSRYFFSVKRVKCMLLLL